MFLDIEMTSELLSAVAGVLLSLAFSYIPGLSGKFASLPSTTKRLIMGGLLLVVAGASFGLSCAGVLDAVACDKPGAMGLVANLIMAIMANQSAYALSPETSNVRDEKALRS